MATNTWTGGSNDGNFATAGNWSLGAAPVNTNDVIIDATSQDITAWPAAVDLASLTITAGYTGSIQSAAGAALTINATTVKITRTVGGAIRLAGTYTTVNVISSGTGAVYLMTSGTTTTLNSGPGTRTIVDSGHVVTNYENNSGVLELDYHATVVTLGETYGSGRTLTHRASTTLRVSGSGSSLRTRQKGTNTLAVGTVRIHEDAMYAHESGGTITTAHVFPRGHLTPLDSPFPFTITTLQERPDSKFTERSSTGSLITVGTRTPVALP